MIAVAVAAACAILSLLFALGSIILRRHVRAVLCLIGSFSCAAALAVVFGAEFLGMTLMTVYVGAVAVLFLFVLMMLDASGMSAEAGPRSHVAWVVPAVAVFGVPFFAALLRTPPDFGAGTLPMAPVAVGKVLYTDHFAAFQTAGLLLTAAMVGAIVLTLRESRGVRRQNLGEQALRDPRLCMRKVQIAPGAPLED